MAHQFSLPPLPYSYEALEPAISSQIMQIHHQKHHQTYITNLNGALAALEKAQSASDVPQLISLQQKIKFNGGGHINHSLFWQNLAPYGSADTEIEKVAPSLKAAIEAQWGSLGAFREAFAGLLLTLQGSGWGWLVKVKSAGEERLEIVSTKDQDPVSEGTPVFGVDMWEHAYYLQYLNNKASYVEGIWKVINWKTAEDRFKNGVRGDSLLKL
ncbi:hypothetical protein N8T08_004941 [Aspergillus melleus]|uniref:Uncharacterized protein n=1 Tax=Aspergillus melleus TaxID=138277 RepID=A0ACC3B385_9EURO|nr:hypothetical protein N8T08_004941 [Aspergillus melleus]